MCSSVVNKRKEKEENNLSHRNNYWKLLDKAAYWATEQLRKKNWKNFEKLKVGNLEITVLSHNKATDASELSIFQFSISNLTSEIKQNTIWLEIKEINSMELPNEIKHGIWLLWVGTGVVCRYYYESLSVFSFVNRTNEIRHPLDMFWAIIGSFHNHVDWCSLQHGQFWISINVLCWEDFYSCWSKRFSRNSIIRCATCT